MITVQFTSVTDTREELAQYRPKTKTCACGRIKPEQYPVCAHCARHPGPYVVIESPSGNYVELSGIESAQSLMERHAKASVSTL